MAVDIVLLEKFLLEYCPKEASEPIMRLFSNFRSHAQSAMASGFMHCSQYLTSEKDEIKHAYVNGLILGALLARTTEIDEAKELFMKGFLEDQKRKRGENVVSMLEKKVEKRC